MATRGFTPTCKRSVLKAAINDPKPMKGVTLGDRRRQQQVDEGWFCTRHEVPRHAYTLAYCYSSRLPKTEAVLGTRDNPISTACPSTFLRNPPDATLYLDVESASLLDADSFLLLQH